MRMHLCLREKARGTRERQIEERERGAIRECACENARMRECMGRYERKQERE